MKFKSLAAVILSVLMLVSCASSPQSSSAGEVLSSTESAEGSSAPQSASQEGYPVTIETFDYAGNPVQTTYEKAPEKVLAVYQGCIETMLALGLEDHVVAAYGLDNEVKEEWQEAFQKINYQSEPFAPDAETVTVMQPDLIFSWGSLFGDKMLGDVHGWLEQGVNTYMVRNTATGAGRTLENEYQDLRNIAAIFNVREKGEALIAEMQEEVAKAQEAASKHDTVRVLVVEPMGDTIRNYGADSLAGDMVQKLGGTLAIEASADIGKEDLLAANADVIFVVYMAYSGDSPEQVLNAQLDVITADDALQTLSAVQNERVYPIMLGDIYASGVRSIDGIRALSQGMYGEAAV